MSGSHGRVQKAGAPGSKSTVQNGARRFGVSPHSPPPSVQYMPTPNELPAAHGSPQPMPSAQLSSSPPQAASAASTATRRSALLTEDLAVVRIVEAELHAHLAREEDRIRGVVEPAAGLPEARALREQHRLGRLPLQDLRVGGVDRIPLEVEDGRQRLVRLVDLLELVVAA